MGSASPWTRWAQDGRAHAGSCLPALTKGPAPSGQASQQPWLPFCQPIPEGHGSLVLATCFSFDVVSSPRNGEFGRDFSNCAIFFFKGN